MSKHNLALKTPAMLRRHNHYLATVRHELKKKNKTKRDILVYIRFNFENIANR